MRSEQISQKIGFYNQSAIDQAILICFDEEMLWLQQFFCYFCLFHLTFFQLYYFIAQMQINQPDLFQAIKEQFKSEKQYEDYIEECHETYDLKVYRIQSMTRKQAFIYYQELQDKYNSGIYQRSPISWYQNERRLFIWFLVCYIKLQGLQALENQSNWESLSQLFFGKDHRLLKYQYMNILKRGSRVNWNEDQDEVVTQAFNKFQKGEWNEIAKELYFSGKSTQFKNPKNCRERWNNHLNKQIKKDPWTTNEDLEMLMLIREKGKKWSHVAKNLNQKRTEHQIKNRYNSLINNADKKLNENQALNRLISVLAKKNQNSKFNFLNTMRVVKEEQKICTPIILIRSYDSHQEKPQYMTQGGTALVYCGKTNGIDQNITSQIEEKLFESNYLSQIRTQNHIWLDRSMFNTPGQNFLDRSSDYEKKIGENFTLSQKFSLQKSHSDFTTSMEFLKMHKSQFSEQFKLLSSSCTDIRGSHSFNYDFSTDLKEM